MINPEEKNLRDRIIKLGFDFDKIKHTIDKITAQIDEEKKIKNRSVWLAVDFEKVKCRIAKITAQLDEVHRQVEEGVSKHRFSQINRDRSDGTGR